VTDLRQRIPVVRRARGYYLYTVFGKRYLDLWQNGGSSLLGHRPGRLTTVLKDTISRGLIADLPSVFQGRLVALLQKVFPGYADFRVTGSLAEALQLASLYLGRDVAAAEVVDPLTEAAVAGSATVSLWRPLLPDPPSADLLLPVLPFAVAGAPAVVCFRRSLAREFPVQAPISGVLLAGLLRCLHDLLRFSTPQWIRADLLAGCPGWRQEQHYIVPEFDPGRYEQVFEAFLDQQVLLSPEAPYVSILPGGEISRGELGKMIGLFRTYPGE
jgi:hypothetical protein